MRRKWILLPAISLFLASLACSPRFDIPTTPVQVGPTVNKPIEVPMLDDPSQTAEVSLAFGAGDLRVSPGAQEELVAGTARFNLEALKPEVNITGNQIRIQQGEFEINGLPERIDVEPLVNEWDLALGDGPISLRIMAGAYVGHFELGGLSLKDLRFSDGAADVHLTFSEPNQVEMDQLRYETGASSVEIDGLANANFERMIFRGGAGNFRLDFSGELQRDAEVEIEVGFSSLTLSIPEGISARVSVEDGLSITSVSEAWEVVGDEYILEGTGPTLGIQIRMAAGSLELRN